MNNFTVLMTLLILAACNEITPVAKKLKNSDNSYLGGGGGPKPTLVAPTKVVRVRNYNQYNMTLEKLTELDRSKYNVLFNSIKGSMPADNDIGGLTPFNLVAMTRLADAYCFDYINQKVDASLFSSPNEEGVIELFIERFLDPATDADYSNLRTELRNVLSNSDGLGGVLFPDPGTNATQTRKNLAVAACVAVLASPYITLLE